MSLVITNGHYYLMKAKTGISKIKKTKNRDDAEIFSSVGDASDKIKRASGILGEYYVYDTETKKVCWELYKCGQKRKRYSQTTRKIIYERAKGCCQLCGTKITFEEMTLDHIIPLAVGGLDSEENLQASCYACNQFKGQILPGDFLEHVARIFWYQLEKKHGKNHSTFF